MLVLRAALPEPPHALLRRVVAVAVLLEVQDDEAAADPDQPASLVFWRTRVGFRLREALKGRVPLRHADPASPRDNRDGGGGHETVPSGRRGPSCFGRRAQFKLPDLLLVFAWLREKE